MNLSHRLHSLLDDADLVVIGDSALVQSRDLFDMLKRAAVPLVRLTSARRGNCVLPYTGRFFSCSPADKARLVRKLREEGARVAFLGFGGTDLWGMQCADVRVDSTAVLGAFGILPASVAEEAA